MKWYVVIVAEFGRKRNGASRSKRAKAQIKLDTEQLCILCRRKLSSQKGTKKKRKQSRF